jgi:hypothetical protein
MDCTGTVGTGAKRLRIRRALVLRTIQKKLSRYEELLHTPRYTLRLTEDHSYWIDQMGVATFRRFLLSVGARLGRKGALNHRNDVLFLYVDEVRDALRSGGHKRNLVAERRATFEAAARIVPQDHPGAPAPFHTDPLFAAIIDKNVRPGADRAQH